MKSRSARYLAAGFLAGLALLVTVTGLNLAHASRAQESALWVAHTQQERYELNDLLSIIQDVQTGTRGFVLTGNEAFLEPYDAALMQVAAKLRRLRARTADNPEQQRNLDTLEPLIADRLAISARLVRLRRDAGFAAAQAAVASGQGKAAMDAVRAQIARMDAAEVRLLAAREATNRSEVDSARALTLIFSGLGMAALVVVFAVVLRENQLRTAAVARASELLRRQDLIVGSIADGLHGLGPDGTINFENPAAERMLGYARGELLGKPAHLTIHHHHADGAEYPVAACPIYATLRDGEARTVRDEVFWRKDGTSFPVEYDVSPVTDEAGRRLGAIVTFHDASERRQHELALRRAHAGLEQRVRERTAELELERAKLKAAFASMPLGVVLSDAQGGNITMNPAAERMLGGAERADLHTQVGDYAKVWELRDAAGRVLPFAEWPLPRAIAGDYCRDEEISLRHLQSGRAWDCSFTAAAVRGGGGDTTLIVLTLLDITARRRAVAEIRALNASLEQRVAERTSQLEVANRELSSFSYSVSHDLRSPLRGIDGFSQALEEDYAEKLDETGRGHLARVRAAARRMSGLIDDLLRLSQITRAELRRQPVDLSRLARTVAAELNQREPRRQVAWEIADGLGAEGDPQLLRVALENLLGNAWKFAGRRPEARIEFGRLPPGGPPAFFVRDNGAGFDMAHAQKLFGAFQRLHTQAEFEGTGIGLATVQRVVHRHGGRVWAEGEVNRGATFYFTL